MAKTKEQLGKGGGFVGALERNLCNCGCGQVERYLAFFNDHQCDKKVTADRAIAFFCRYRFEIREDSIDDYLDIICGCGERFPIAEGDHS